jgi:hypothetical protein
MTEREFKGREVQIAQYWQLSRDVTDPLAACLLRVIVEELEAELKELDSRSGLSRGYG